MSDFIAFADQRLADQKLVDQSHVRFLSRNLWAGASCPGRRTRRETIPAARMG
jgi:hypothetical protein